MKNIIISIFGIMALLAMLITSSVMAEERYVTFEMGESGHIISFKMTTEEITVEDSANTRLAKLNSINKKNTKRWVEKIEIGETGSVIEFLMSPVEIEIAKMSLRNAAKKELLWIAESVKADGIEIVEMADGHELTFLPNERYLEDCSITWVSSLFTSKAC